MALATPRGSTTTSPSPTSASSINYDSSAFAAARVAIVVDEGD
jgi:hypothetical protein